MDENQARKRLHFGGPLVVLDVVAESFRVAVASFAAGGRIVQLAAAAAVGTAGCKGHASLRGAHMHVRADLAIGKPRQTP